MVLVGPASPGRDDFVSEGLINTNQAAFFQGVQTEDAVTGRACTECFGSAEAVDLYHFVL